MFVFVLLLCCATLASALRRAALHTQDLSKVAAEDFQGFRANPEVCDETLSGPMDAGYRGCQNTTISGRTCRHWTESQKYWPDNYPDKGLGDHNYCRNPDGEPTIWCFTTDPQKEWEFCNPRSALLLHAEERSSAAVGATVVAATTRAAANATVGAAAAAAVNATAGAASAAVSGATRRGELASLEHVGELASLEHAAVEPHSWWKTTKIAPSFARRHG